MIFLDSYQTTEAPVTQDFSEKLYRWSDEAFYHLALLTTYKSGLAGVELSQQGFGTFGGGELPAPEADRELPTRTGKGGDGLQPSAYYARQLIIDKFGIHDIGGYENRTIHGTNHLSDHALGLALDVMVYTNKGLGQQVADYFVANYQALKVKYVIWYRQIWTSRGSRSLYWRPYFPPGGPTNNRTLNHEDHVHISFLP